MSPSTAFFSTTRARRPSPRKTAELEDLEFVMANGTIITRSVGFAIVRVEEAFTVDEVVFAEEATCSCSAPAAWKA